jgi:hypothetical protein
MRAFAPRRPLRSLRLALPLIAAGAACAGAPPAPRAPPAPPVAEQAPPPPRRPAFATSGWVKPREAQPGCVASAFVPPATWKPKGTVTAKFAVDEAGRVDRFEDVSEPPDPAGRVTPALERAVGSCRFLPGLDQAGQPAYLWLLLSVPVARATR